MQLFTHITQDDRSATSSVAHQCWAVRSILALAVFVLAASTILAGAQMPFAPTSTTNADVQQNADQNGGAPVAMDGGADSNDERDMSASSSAFGSSSALSADQIIGILQQNPDLVTDLKSMAAGRIEQQGSQIDPSEITDQMLYSQIATNANLRVSITTYLRARGYVTDDELASARLASAGEDDGGVSSSAQKLGVPPGESDGSVSSSQGARDRDGQISAANRINSRPRRDEARGSASTDLPRVINRPTPYDLQSMRDLYTQIPGGTAPLKRFGSDVFLERNASAAMLGTVGSNAQLDVPLGPDYVLGSGDTLEIEIWGGMTQSFSRVIERDGRVLLPEAGSVQVAGLSLSRAQDLIESALKPQFRDAHVAVTVPRLHSVRVYVVGDVQRPGGYDLSSLSTPLSALYAAGGPTSVGSLRVVRHMRGDKVVEEVDLYDFLLHGVRDRSVRFESGDTLQVPPAGPQVAIAGAVKRPAIYELKGGETSLNNVIDDAGGLTAAASLDHITIERIDADRQRETVTLQLKKQENPQSDGDAIKAFQVRDGDRIRIEPILAYSERAIYVEGHVARPGRFSYIDGMHLSDVLRSSRDLLPEPASHGEIVRLCPPDLHAETIEFDVPDVLIGNANVALQPFDTIRIFGRYEIDAPKATILGEVLRPGTYPLSRNMTAAQLVRMAGGFKRDALLESADLTSYGVNGGKEVIEKLSTIRIGAAVAGTDPSADSLLKPGDILSVHQITGWNDIGESITVEGQVRFPGSYGFKDGERLSAVLRRAGGFIAAAYPAGAVLVRQQVLELQQKSRDELVRQIETNSAAARLSPGVGGTQTSSALELIKAQQNQVLAELKSHPPTGRMVIHISADIDSWAGTSADIELRRGDVLTIPKRPGFVLVTGQVYNATALTFSPGKTAGWYLSRAGGTNSTANRKEVFIIRANGSVVGRRSGGWFEGDVLSTKLEPGDIVVVPQKIFGTSLLWRNLLTTAQLASSIAITTAVAAL